MKDISKHMRLLTVKELLSTKADLSFCKGPSWWVSNDEQVTLPKNLAAEHCCASTENENPDVYTEGIRPVLVLPDKYQNDFELNKIYTFGTLCFNLPSNTLPVRWVYIGNGLLLSYEILAGTKDVKKINKSIQKIALTELFTLPDLKSIFGETFPKRMKPYDGIFVIGPDIPEIPSGAYIGCDYIKKIIIKERTEPLVIGSYAFAGTSCEEIEGLEYCTEIQECAFAQTFLRGTLKIGNLAEISPFTFANNQITTVDLTDFLGAIGTSAFYSNNISSVLLGDGITNLQETAFAENCLTQQEIKNIKDSVLLSYDETAFSSQRTDPYKNICV